LRDIVCHGALRRHARLSQAFEDLGEHTVKNIDKPIRVFARS